MFPTAHRNLAEKRHCLLGKSSFLLVSILLAGSPPVLQGETHASAPVLVASPESGWPQWRGPLRDGICTETNLLSSWPEGGPKLLWQLASIGKGYSAPIIVEGQIYLAGDVGDDLVIYALSVEGKHLWKATNGASWKTPYPGARASCTYASGRIVHLNAHARLGCYDAATGAELWSADLRERLGSRKTTWATSECVLVDGSRVIVTVGGTHALLAALDLGTGEIVWTTPPTPASETPTDSRQKPSNGEPDPPSYASPILVDFGDHRQIIGCSQRQVFGIDAGSGKLLWTRPLRTRYDVVAMTPVLVGNSVFVTAPDTDQGGLHRIRKDKDHVWVEEIWRTTLNTCHGGVVLVDNALYGSWYRPRKGWACVDPNSGAVRYETSSLAQGSVLYADNRLYVVSEEGDVALLRPTSSAFEVKGRFRLVPERKNDVWTHPVILNGRLYLRYHDSLWCYDIKSESKATE